jgi:hypothetical protein
MRRATCTAGSERENLLARRSHASKERTMAEDNAYQNQQDEELSVEELDEVAGGLGDTNNGCNFVAGCGASRPDTGSGPVT